MASRFEPVTDPDKAWEYRQAGLLYWQSSAARGWVITGCEGGLSRDMQERMMYGYANYRYAILVEEDDNPTTEDSCG